MDKENIAMEISVKPYMRLKDYTDKSAKDFKRMNRSIKSIFLKVLKENISTCSTEGEERIVEWFRNLKCI